MIRESIHDTLVSTLESILWSIPDTLLFIILILLVLAVGAGWVALTAWNPWLGIGVFIAVGAYLTGRA